MEEDNSDRTESEGDTRRDAHHNPPHRRAGRGTRRRVVDRHGQITDPFGHRWGLAQHVRDVPAEELVRAAAEAFGV